MSLNSGYRKQEENTDSKFCFTLSRSRFKFTSALTPQGHDIMNIKTMIGQRRD
jgi:hypothetical protein